METLNTAVKKIDLTDGDSLIKYTKFFEFPRELRNAVYAQLWNATTQLRLWTQDLHVYIIAYGKPLFSRYIMDYDSDIKSSPQLPQWLLTSKTMLSEGCAEFERHCTTMLAFGHLESLNPHTFEHFTFGKISGPSTRKDLRIMLQELKFDNGSDEAHRWRLRRYDRNGLYELLPMLAGTSLQDLYIVIRVRGWSNYRHQVSVSSTDCICDAG